MAMLAARRFGSLARFLVPLVAAKEPLVAAVPARGFASKSSVAVSAKSEKSPDSSLIKCLKSELDHEKQEQGKSKESMVKHPSPFTLEDKPGSQEIILRRSFGSEDIAITCVFRLSPYDEPMEEEEDDDEADQPVSQEEVHMNVTISKVSDGPVLEVSCTCSQGELVIEKVSYLESASSKEDEMAYTGPEFDELDEDLQEQFRKYLEARGINDELCNFLVNYMPEKERQEYVRWLDNVGSFLRK